MTEWVAVKFFTVKEFILCSTVIVEFMVSRSLKQLHFTSSLWGKWDWWESSCLGDLWFHNNYNDDDNNYDNNNSSNNDNNNNLQYYTWQLF